MAVIYLPPNPNNIGAGLGAGFGQFFGNWALQQEKMRQKKQETEASRVTALESVMKMPGANDPGTKVGEFAAALKQPNADPNFIKQLFDLKRQGEADDLNKQYIEGKMKLDKAEVPLKEAQAAHQAAEAKLLPAREQLLAAQTKAAQLNAAATEANAPAEKEKLKAEANKAVAQARLYKTEADKIIDTRDRAKKFIEQLTQEQNPQGAGGASSSGAAPQARTVADTNDEPPSRADAIQAGPGGSEGLVPAQPAGISGGRGNAAGQGSTFKEQLSKLSPVEKQYVLGPLMSGDIDKATKNMIEVTKPQYVMKEEQHPDKPGIVVRTRVDERTGQSVPLGEIDKRKAPTKEMLKAATGLDQFRAVNNDLKQASDRDEFGNFGRGGRQVDQLLISHGFDPLFGGKEATDVVVAQQHAINGVMSMLAGTGRPNQWLEKQMMNNVIKLTDTKDIRETKFRKFDTLMDIASKDLYDGATESGIRPPKSVKEYVEKKGLDKMTMEELQQKIIRQTASDKKKKEGVPDYSSMSTDEIKKLLEKGD